MQFQADLYQRFHFDYLLASSFEIVLAESFLSIVFISDGNAFAFSTKRGYVIGRDRIRKASDIQHIILAVSKVLLDFFFTVYIPKYILYCIDD